jgi:hypothetical protein
MASKPRNTDDILQGLRDDLGEAFERTMGLADKVASTDKYSVKQMASDGVELMFKNSASALSIYRGALGLLVAPRKKKKATK